MLTDIEQYGAALAENGLPPVLSGRHEVDDFRAEMVTRELGPLKLVELVTPAGECFRDARNARAADEQLWQIEVMSRGSVRVEHGRSDAVVGPADLVLVDPARPIRYTSTDSRHVSVLVSRQELRLRPADAARLTGVPITGDRGSAALVSSLTRDLSWSATGFSAGGAQRSAAAVIELLAVAFDEHLGDVRPAPDEVLRDRIRGYIEAHLPERDLGPGRIAAAHHISVRRLHKLFQDEPQPVGALVRRRRLERSRAELMRGGCTVAAVAARWGFADPAHFSRLFKATYGYNAAALTSSRRALTSMAARVASAQDGGDTTGEE
ncbi:helix-turn-helix domain-containing protein [Cryptosporangium japonicum]|uniref:Helix-turn-helix domain-containing protein n=1 Tax=Cryptosporangium japonicum TaxID=80872 RepID=A0ABN0V4W6_9ACTN